MNDLLRPAVWAKAAWISPLDPDLGQDVHGNFIRYSAYGDRTSPHGWEIDHEIPACVGGSDALWNLRPIHWRKNASDGGVLGNGGNPFAQPNALRRGMFGFGRR